MLTPGACRRYRVARWVQFQVSTADDFSYSDPVDASQSRGQGLRIALQSAAGEARIVYRLSGTGTEGATLRVYIERFESNAELHQLDPQRALGDLIDLSRDIARIKHFTGREQPSVIT